MATGVPVMANTPSMKVELRISCKNLRESDLLSKSDPLVVVYTQLPKPREGSWNEVERSMPRCVQYLLQFDAPTTYGSVFSSCF